MSNPSFPRMHVSLYVKSIEQTLDFYTKFFGKAPEKVKPGYTKWVLENPALIISFIEKPDRVVADFGHLGFQVETVDELRSKLELMTAYKLKIREEMGTSCCYGLQDKFWVADPDGYQWEVYYFHADVQFNDPHHEIKAISCTSDSLAERSQSQSEGKIKLPLEKLGQCTPGGDCC